MAAVRDRVRPGQSWPWPPWTTPEDRIVGFRVSIIEADPLIQDGLVILASHPRRPPGRRHAARPRRVTRAAEAVKAVTYTTDPSDAVIVDLTDITDRIARYGEVKRSGGTWQRRRNRPSWRTCCVTGSAPGCVAWPVDPWTVTYSKPRRVLERGEGARRAPRARQVGAGPGSGRDALRQSGFDDYREPLGARTLTVRREKET